MFKIGKKGYNQFAYIDKGQVTEIMAEGTRLKELNENIKAMEEKVQLLTTEYHQSMDMRIQ